MLHRFLNSALVGAAIVISAGAAPAATAWPAWLSIESPVNPFDPSTRGAVMLVHAATRDGVPSASDVTAAAEGIVSGARQTIPLRLDPTSHPGVFAVRRQWPTDGAWVVRIQLRQTTALVTFDGIGNVAGARVPTAQQNGAQIPRAVAAREIDSALAVAAKR
ncbi:MAG TPA: hypothetical protein VHV78_17005 [Gemmatimonadaceae bacterium]|jgi:hypothetical protein|nr:hypothetical protein [Gemmatimonadaceae bacterium]